MVRGSPVAGMKSAFVMRTIYISLRTTYKLVSSTTVTKKPLPFSPITSEKNGTNALVIVVLCNYLDRGSPAPLSTHRGSAQIILNSRSRRYQKMVTALTVTSESNKISSVERFIRTA